MAEMTSNEKIQQVIQQVARFNSVDKPAQVVAIHTTNSPTDTLVVVEKSAGNNNVEYVKWYFNHTTEEFYWGRYFNVKNAAMAEFVYTIRVNFLER